MAAKEISSEGFNFKGFKLISLKLTGAKMFGDIEFDFVDSQDIQDKIYSTVIIGPNGTRKSLLFNLIVFIFNSIYNLKNGKEIDYEEYSRYSSGFYQIRYSLNNNVYDFQRNSASLTKGKKFGYYFTINDEKVEIADFELPLGIIANSISIRDKFPFFNKEDFPVYNYIGIKNSPQSASTQGYLRKVIDYVAEHSVDEAFINGLKLIAEKFIGDGKSICLTYKTTQHKNFFSNKVSIEILDEFFQEIEERFKKSGKRPPNKLGNYNKLRQYNSAELNRIISFCKNIDSQDFVFKGKGQSNRTLKFNLSSIDGLSNLKRFNVIIKQLYSIGLLTDIKIEFHDDLFGNYTLEDSSSGEYNLITSFIGLMATIKSNSLILIDEPEISLHPNWQMKYLSFIRELFSSNEYSTTHILIATHSHFLIADLIGENSKIIGLKKEGGIVQIVDLPPNIDTYCWSPDDILYNIFDVASSRNKFVAEEIAAILEALSKGSKNEVNRIDAEIYKTLLHLRKNLKDKDPLKEVVISILNKVQ